MFAAIRVGGMSRKAMKFYLFSYWPFVCPIGPIGPLWVPIGPVLRGHHPVHPLRASQCSDVFCVGEMHGLTAS